MGILESSELRRDLILFAAAVLLFAPSCQTAPSGTQTDAKSQAVVAQKESSTGQTNSIRRPTNPPGNQAESLTGEKTLDLTPAQVESLSKQFQSRIQDYIELRQRVQQEVKKPNSEASAEAIQNYQRRLVERLIEVRSGASQGDLFFAEIQPWFRTTINSTLTESNKTALMEHIEEMGARQIDAGVNVVYPTDHGLSFVFPKLLRVFPELPDDVQYRFAGNSLILLDRDILLILDYLPDAYD